MRAEDYGISGAHLTFNTADEQAALGEMGYLPRTGIQYHWVNNGYASFDDFLMTLKQSKRNNIRKVRSATLFPGAPHSTLLILGWLLVRNPGTHSFCPRFLAWQRCQRLPWTILRSKPRAQGKLFSSCTPCGVLRGIGILLPITLNPTNAGAEEHCGGGPHAAAPVGR